MGKPGLLDWLSKQYVNMTWGVDVEEYMLIGITESSNIPAAPQVARKPHTTSASGATGITGSTLGTTNGNHTGTNGASKLADYASTNTTTGVNPVSY